MKEYWFTVCCFRSDDLSILNTSSANKFAHNVTFSNTSKEWTTPDFRNTPSTTNLEEEEIVDAIGKDGNASMPEQVNRPNPWRKMMMMMMMMPLRFEDLLYYFC